MKIIHLISGGDTGGAKTHVLTLLQGLNRTDFAQLVCFRDGEFAQEAREMGIPTAIQAGNDLVKTVRALTERIREGGFQVIHCHGARANMVGALLKKRTGLPIVTTVHSDYRLDYMGRPLGRLTYGTINTVALRRFDYHIGVSDAMTELLIERGFRPDRIYTIYNGLTFDAQPTLTDRTAYLRSLGAQVEPDSVVVGIAARLNPVKDISTLIRGFARAHASCPRLRLVIAGEGQERQMLGKLAESLGVADQVCFAGWLGDMDSFYQALDINTLTSLSETFSYALTEGARYHLATVSSRVGGVPYLIDHESNGLLFTAGDDETLGRHLLRLAEDEALRRTMGERLFEKASSKFSLDRTIETQRQIYREILRRTLRTGRERDGAVICGAYGQENTGDDAILDAILTELREVDPDLPVTVLSRQPKRTRLSYRVPSVHTFDFLAWHRALRHSRLYISGGGSLIQDVTSTRSLLYYLHSIRAAHRLGNRVMMYGCGIGPVSRAVNRKRAARVLNKHVDAITLREPSSQEELRDMGVTVPQIHLAADPALILPPASPEVVDGWMTANGLALDGRYCCFIIRQWPGIRDKLPDILSAAAYAYERYGLTPVFLAIEQLHDPALARRLGEACQVPCHVVTAAMPHRVVIGLLGRMALLVSMRLHSLIFAAGQGVPMVGLVYDPKVSAFLRYIGQDLYIDLQALTPEVLQAMLDAAVARGEDRAAMEAGLARLRALERVNTQTLERLLAQ